MNSEKEVVCPNCEEKFKPANHCWRLCLECGKVFEPHHKEEWREHKRNECIHDLGVSLKIYSKEEAQAKQQEWLEGYMS